MFIHTNYKYGQDGPPLDPERCPASVADGGGFHYYQCSRKGKNEEEYKGKTYKFCHQHTPSKIQAKREAEAAAWHAEDAAKEVKWQRKKLEREFCDGVDDEYLRTHTLKDLITHLGGLTDLLDELDNPQKV